MIKKTLPFLLALALGILSWHLIAPFGADQEAWDNPLYWRLAYPVICLGCALLGYFFYNNAWAYGLLAMGIQGIPPILTHFEAELIAVSVIALLLLCIPPVLAGLLGAWIRRRNLGQV